MDQTAAIGAELPYQHHQHQHRIDDAVTPQDTRRTRRQDKTSLRARSPTSFRRRGLFKPSANHQPPHTYQDRVQPTPTPPPAPAHPSPTTRTANATSLVRTRIGVARARSGFLPHQHHQHDLIELARMAHKCLTPHHQPSIHLKRSRRTRKRDEMSLRACSSSSIRRRSGVDAPPPPAFQDRPWRLAARKRARNRRREATRCSRVC